LGLQRGSAGASGFVRQSPPRYSQVGASLPGCRLLTYGRDVSERFRLAAGYVDKILKGAKPADLPMRQPTRFQLVVNLRTAKTLGLTIPAAILDLADDVIE
jgi:putative tryptophan/tyrosine transport system substrate-binding protein